MMLEIAPGHDVPIPPADQYRVTYLGHSLVSESGDAHAGETATVVARKSLLAWIIRIQFSNGDLYWVADSDTEVV
jgi:hypothetical protein